MVKIELGHTEYMLYRSLILILVLSGTCSAQKMAIGKYVQNFVADYNALGIPEMEYDYTAYFRNIPGKEQLQAQMDLFMKGSRSLSGYIREQLSDKDKVVYDHLSYEITINIERIRLEQEWVKNGRNIPGKGLYKLSNGKAWYALFVKRYTTTETSPEQVYTLGEAEVKKVRSEIKHIQYQVGLTDSSSFYRYLNSSSFFISDKQELLNEFERVDKMVRAHLTGFIGTGDIPPVFAMQWPGATAQTPPGMYLNHAHNAYGKDVFQFNFHSGRYNRRAIEWLYMHEAIPGHHLQFSMRKSSNALQDLFTYPGNFEGWGCYVEYFGKELGLYDDPYMYLGKWEWDLVRSARSVIDAGIHYFGWTREQALAYWKQNIPNQDEIAEREVTRVTNWPCQALSYKVGADKIFNMQKEWQLKHPGSPLSKFYHFFLDMGNLPLTVIERNIS